MKLFYEALLRSRTIFAVNREGNKMTYYVKKCPKRLHRHMCCTQTQWSHHNCHHLEQGTQHLLFLCAGSSGTRELSSCLFTVYSSKIMCSTTTKLQFLTAMHPGFTHRFVGWNLQGSCTAYQLSDDLAKSVLPVRSSRSERFLSYITLKRQQSTSSKYLPLSICTSIWHWKKKVNFR